MREPRRSLNLTVTIVLLLVCLCLVIVFPVGEWAGHSLNQLKEGVGVLRKMDKNSNQSVQDVAVCDFLTDPLGLLKQETAQNENNEKL